MQSKTTTDESLRWLASRMVWESRLEQLREATANEHDGSATAADHGLAA